MFKLKELQIDLDRETKLRKTLQIEAINMKEAHLNSSMEAEYIVTCQTQLAHHIPSQYLTLTLRNVFFYFVLFRLM